MQNVADLDSGNGKTYREINNETKHKLEVGRLVELDDGVRLFVVKKTRGFKNHSWLFSSCDNLKAI